ncbi:MAG: type II secretion system protein, partial [Planctomycetota bacterium]
MAERGRSQAVRGAQAGLTLIELLVTLAIVAGAIAALQYSASQAYRSAVETNHIRIAKMLLRTKAEEVFAGVETGTGGGFEGYPEAFSWSVSEHTA